MEKSSSCDKCYVDIHRASFAKHLRIFNQLINKNLVK